MIFSHRDFRFIWMNIWFWIILKKFCKKSVFAAFLTYRFLKIAKLLLFLMAMGRLDSRKVLLLEEKFLKNKRPRCEVFKNLLCYKCITICIGITFGIRTRFTINCCKIRTIFEYIIFNP